MKEHNISKLTSPKKRLLGPVALIFDSVKTGSWRIVRPQVDAAKCTGCGQCQTFCPTAVIEIIPVEGEKKRAKLEIDWNYCKGCGICAEVCPGKCIIMVPEPGTQSHPGEEK